MTPKQIKWILFIVPALVIGGFETIRHTVLSNVIPLELGNWITALIDAAIIAILSRQMFHLVEKNQTELSFEREQRAILEERERLAREMHDQIAQSIFYAGIQVQSIQQRAEKFRDAELQNSLNDVLVSLREMDDNIRQAIFNLKQPLLDNATFLERVRSYLAATLGDNGIQWRIDADSGSLSLDSTEQLQLFGILQEAVTNIIKHSRASSVIVSLKKESSTQHRWIFAIEDDGIGFDLASTAAKRYGLEIIANRARDINATAKIESNPADRHTRVSVEKNS